MSRRIKKSSPVTFGFAVFCFLLPFVTISCPGAEARFSGVQVMLGTTIEEPTMFGEPKKKRIEGEPLAQLTFLFACLGVVLGLLKVEKERAVGTLAVGGVGVFLLLALKMKIGSEIVHEGGGMFEVSFGLGFWLTLLAFLTAVALSCFLLSSNRRRQVEEAGLPENLEPPSALGSGSL